MSVYDAIIVGAGNGGMTAALTLAMENKKVLLLERHNIPGGCGTSFRRGRFEFEVALHQLSGMGSREKPGSLRRFMKKWGVEDEIEWVEMHQLYRVVYPGHLDLRLGTDMQEVIAVLQERFPAEKEAIAEYIKTCYLYAYQEYMIATEKNFDESKTAEYELYLKYAGKTAEEVLNEFFRDPLLKLSLNMYWTYMGMKPSRLPFALMAGLTYVYQAEKPYHVIGGSQTMSNALVNKFIQYGGEVRFNTPVRKILVEDGKVRGVETAAGDVLTSDVVISNASTIDTYVNLVDDPTQVPEAEMRSLGSRDIGTSGFVIYLGLDATPAELGIRDPLTVFYQTDDMEESFANAHSTAAGNCDMIISCYTLDDPRYSPTGCTQLAIVTLSYADAWLGVPSEQYHEVKYKRAAELLEKAETIYPGLSEHIEEMEIATPLTFMRYLNHPGGAFYGFDQNIKDNPPFLANRSAIEGLYFAGTWVGTCGFQPTMMSGYKAARTALRTMGKGGR
ncbi:MAG TPA: NAD(P)/FAD-dependent oxidoreductase [Syntrophomonas sp.]|nr:NAD(P)/FAD-dependent oxidoreductase [Syntrophomonas sp.]